MPDKDEAKAAEQIRAACRSWCNGMHCKNCCYDKDGKLICDAK